jgi:uncharacterized protein (UPF0332 family)
MSKRQESDYDDFLEFSKEEILPLIDDVESFIVTIQKLINI